MMSNHRAPFSRSGGVGPGLVQTLHPSRRFPMQCSIVYLLGHSQSSAGPSPQCLWLLIIDSTHGAAVNPGFKGGKR